MVDQTILNTIRNYLQAANEAGFHTNRAVLYGSWARGEATEDSDIDLVVLAPEFDDNYSHELVSKLWQLRIQDPEAWRIEPIACGEREWLKDDSRAIIEIARREGIMITLKQAAA